MRQTFAIALRACLPGPPSIAVIHSSLPGLMPPAGFGRWEVLHGLSALIAEGWTVALPAFTFSFCAGTPFHARTSGSEVGVAADWLLAEFADARRTRHPIYSFVVAGPDRDRIMACPSTTTFGEDSPFGLFEREDAIAVMLGCGWTYATQFHRSEEVASVPYRYFKDFAGNADFDDGAGSHAATASMYVRELGADPHNDFTPLVSLLRTEGRIRSVELWRGRIEAARVQDIARAGAGLLATDPLALIANPAVVAHRLTGLAHAAAQPPLRIAILGSSNVHLLAQALQRSLAASLTDQRIEYHEPPFGQLEQELIASSSPLRRFQAQVSVFCDRIEDILGRERLDGPLDVAAITGLIEERAVHLAAYHQANGGWMIVHRFAMLQPAIDDRGGLCASDLVAQLNEVLHRRLAQLPQVLFVDIAAEAASCPAAVLDARLWHLARMPFSDAFSRRLAAHWSASILAITGRSVRVLALDLDNTLWGGVLGEDGLDGVQLGGDFPGNAYAAFQSALMALAQRGIALVVCSKNDQTAALAAIDALPGMRIRTRDLATHRIGWQAKWQSIRDIASELNLGLDAFLFIDDNPVEREEMRRHNPGVRVLELPGDPSAYAAALMECPWLGVAGLTAEDRSRSRQYQARRQIEEQRGSAGSMEDFYAGLGMTVHLQPLCDRTITRAAQLCAKTNQFNSTTRRYDQHQLRALAAKGADVVVIGLEDRTSTAMENIGLLVLRQDPGDAQLGIIDSYLLSCRVLGRGLETALLRWAVRRCARRDWHMVQGLIIETARNVPVRSVFKDAGFQPGVSAGQWLTASSLDSPLPTWLAIRDGTVDYVREGA